MRFKGIYLVKQRKTLFFSYINMRVDNERGYHNDGIRKHLFAGQGQRRERIANMKNANPV